MVSSRPPDRIAPAWASRPGGLQPAKRACALRRPGRPALRQYSGGGRSFAVNHNSGAGLRLSAARPAQQSGSSHQRRLALAPARLRRQPERSCPKQRNGSAPALQASAHPFLPFIGCHWRRPALAPAGLRTERPSTAARSGRPPSRHVHTTSGVHSSSPLPLALPFTPDCLRRNAVRRIFCEGKRGLRPSLRLDYPRTPIVVRRLFRGYGLPARAGGFACAIRETSRSRAPLRAKVFQCLC